MMLNQVLGMLASMFTQIFGIFDRIFTELDAWGLILGAFLCFSVYRILLVPIVGGLMRSGTSDVVKEIKGSVEKNGKSVEVKNE